MTTHHATGDDKGTPDACADGDSDDVLMTTTRAESHFARQDCIYVIVADYRTAEMISESCGKRDAFEEFKFRFEPDDRAGVEVDPTRTANADCLNRDTRVD